MAVRSPAASSAPSTGERFAVGSMLGERFRIVSLLGKGAMGEVYRADDLKLGHPVALKFLPEALQNDPGRLERFYNEVRVARQISHPAVCRVHDIGEVDGLHFLSMEYVDGEDLASLQRRIGRLPTEKAVEIVRQICAGLAAAHERGVLHRDLKPENVMLDGRGKVRLTDFGLAAFAEAVTGAESRSGTPAYMSPEQFEGREVTLRSDIYSLGLLLYELFTGRRAFDGRTLPDLARQHREESPAPPTQVVDDLPPAIERAILRCLEKDPRERPSSALAVAAALPGGDPLAAALAAGETPSPELVAAAGLSEGLRHSTALALLLGTLAALAVFPFLNSPLTLFRLTPFEKAPAVLEDRARELLQKLGHDGRAVDAAAGFAIDTDFFEYVVGRDPSATRWDVLRSGEPAVIQYWYRQSPLPLVSDDSSGQVYWVSPSITISGMTGVKLDTQGRLVELYAVPPQRDDSPGAPSEPDWRPLFEQAALDPEKFRRVEPRWTPPFYGDTRAAWEGAYVRAPGIPLRVEAAAYRGKPVYFTLVPPWRRAERMQPRGLSPAGRTSSMVLLVLALVVLGAAALLARHQLRIGRGDRRGALRLAAFTCGADLLAWTLGAHHVADLVGEVTLVFLGISDILAGGATLWLLYVALEPYVRRRWPHTLISWSRLLAGRISDPLVGRDLLLGVAGGALTGLLIAAAGRILLASGGPAPTPTTPELDVFLGLSRLVDNIISRQIFAVVTAMGLLMILLLLRLLVRREWLAVATLLAIYALPSVITAESVPWLEVPLIVAILAVPTLVLTRYGLLAMTATVFVASVVNQFPLTSDLGHWTGSVTVTSMLVLAGLAAYAYRTSLAGRSALAVYRFEPPTRLPG